MYKVTGKPFFLIKIQSFGIFSQYYTIAKLFCEKQLAKARPLRHVHGKLSFHVKMGSKIF